MGKKYVIPEGTRDLVPKEYKIKKGLQKNIEEIFEKWGYREVVTPTIEFYQTFNSIFENIKEEEVYKFFDYKGKILILRPDMTIPIARIVASKFKDMKEPLRFRYSSNVFRMNESLVGKRNEYTDCGVELIGASGINSDLEVLVTALDVMQVVKGNNTKLEIGNINFFNSAIEDLDLDDEKKSKLAELIDKKSMKELYEFLDSIDINQSYRKFFKELPWLFGDREVLKLAKTYCFNDKLIKSIKYLEKLAELLKQLGYEKEISFDLGMVQKLNYYTGITFRGFVEGVGMAVLSGGRYDSLIGNFGDDRAAIGFSINIDNLMDTMDKNNYKNEEIYKVNYGDENVVEAFYKAKQLRKSGHIVEMKYDDKLKKIIVSKEGAEGEH